MYEVLDAQEAQDKPFAEEPKTHHTVSVEGEPGDYWATVTVFGVGGAQTIQVHARGATALEATRNGYAKWRKAEEQT